ncbi:MAG TPA: HIT family protein [Flavobacteriales bacterium]|jgi:histidine triad (HIT) family protein|nr:HIT family protein [Salibacteraceae bacterium]HAS35448.1 HIT family protein [Flavobacteriales bacterium]
MASIFSKIVAGEIPSYKIAETENCLAFLDVFPLQEGHTLVIPKKEVNYLFDLPEELYAELMSFSKEVSKAVKKAMPCERIGVAVIGLEVPHAHVHLIPITQMDDMNFANPKLKIEANRMEQIASAIRSEL